MKLQELTAISPVDGRYRSKTQILGNYFSEYALIRYRLQVEVEYFIFLQQLGIPQLADIQEDIFEKLRELYRDFSLAGAERVKTIEKKTNHDVKSVEYFLKEEFDKLGLAPYKEFIHFGLTSQDINNTAVPLSLKEFYTEALLPQLKEVTDQLKQQAYDWQAIPMLARTHGQPASPTRLGKEMMVFVVRIEEQLKQLQAIPFSAKFGGATGNFNAHKVAFPKIDWPVEGERFVNEILQLHRTAPTTQIEHYDNMAAFFDAVKRINTILLDLCRDMWTYISMDYFKQKIKKDEVGSSAMPHKVNPIDFENAEGNLGIANAIFEHLSAKLPVSRLQRDLTDSTVTRNIGVPLGHTFIALKSLVKGLRKVLVNEVKILADLNNNWNVVAEAIQTILRREGHPNPYEMLKELTRTNEKMTPQKILQFIDNLDISEDVKTEMRNITPLNYTGYTA